MQNFKSKKIFLTADELMQCQEDMLQFATKQQELEVDLENASNRFKAEKKAFESDIEEATSSMRDNMTLLRQKYKYVDVPYSIFTDNELRKEFHIQTDEIELLEVKDIPLFANPEFEFSNYSIILIDGQEKAQEVFDNETSIFTTTPIKLICEELNIELSVYRLANEIRVVRWTNPLDAAIGFDSLKIHALEI